MKRSSLRERGQDPIAIWQAAVAASLAVMVGVAVMVEVVEVMVEVLMEATDCVRGLFNLVGDLIERNRVLEAELVAVQSAAQLPVHPESQWRK